MKKKRKQTPLATETDILDGVRSGAIFGLVQVDIRTPDWLKPQLAEFPPIFKHATVGREDIGPFMKAYCEKHNVLKKPSKMLISSYYAERILLITPLLKFYLDLGLQVTKVHLLVEFPEHRPCFEKFATQVCDARRMGDKSTDSDILANTFKLIGNSAYGRICMNKAKQTQTKYADATFATHLINTKRFKRCTKIDADLFEIELCKKAHKHDLPLQCGVWTYQIAKLRMLQWHIQFLQYYLPKTNYQLTQMDTDSSYFGLSESTLEECVYPEKKREFYENYHRWFPTLACSHHRKDFVETKLKNETWTPGDCCRAAHVYDKRTSGLFKLEYSGSGIVALCSKTYICFGEEGTKLSSKGIQKKRNLHKLCKEAYLKVLETQCAGFGVNKGFVTVKGKVYTYAQVRRGLSYLYCKRKIAEDGISTVPLDL